MKRLPIALLVFPLLLLAACERKPAATAGAIAIVDPWARPASSGGNSAAYMVIRNGGSQADRLTKVEYPGAGAVEIHETTMKDDVMSMSPVPQLEVPAEGEAVLRPGSYHVMIMMLGQELRPGDTVSMTLTFERAGRIPVVATVRQP